MLVLTRKENECIEMTGAIRVIVVSIRDQTVRLGIEAPPECKVARSEIADGFPGIENPRPKPQDPRPKPQDRPAADRVYYLACSYTHADPSVRDARYTAANEATAKLIRAGLNVFSPIVHSHALAVRCGLPEQFDFWRRWNLAILAKCDGLIVLAIDGYLESVGVRAEMRAAARAGKPITILYPEFTPPRGWEPPADADLQRALAGAFASEP